MKKQNKIKSGFRSLPLAEMRVMDKMNPQGRNIAHLYIDGKTDGTEYEKQDNTFTGGTHSVKFSKEMVKLKCKSIPNNMYASLRFDKPLLKNNFLQDKEEVSIWKKKNVMEMYFYFEGAYDGRYNFLCLNPDRISDHMQRNILKNNKSGVYFEKDQLDFVPIIKGKSDETLTGVLNRLVKAVDMEMKKAKELLLKELLRLKKDIENNSVKWESTKMPDNILP